MDFLKDTAKVGVYGIGFSENCRVVDLLRVEIHLDPTPRANHLARV
jgi:hypothetical protein